MMLNEFICSRIGATFEDLYNSLAIKEILNNKEKYPSIYEMISKEVNSSNILDKAKGNWPYFDYDSDEDEPTNCPKANYQETIELYFAFVRAFCKNIRKKSYTIKSFLWGTDYFNEPNVSVIIDYDLYRYKSKNFFIMNIKKVLQKEYNYPEDVNNLSLGRLYNKSNLYTFYNNFDSILTNLKEVFNSLIDSDELISQNFDKGSYKSIKVKLDDGLEGYPYDSCEITIGKNNLIFPLERSNSPFEKLIQPVISTLSDKEKEVERMLNIFEQNYVKDTL